LEREKRILVICPYPFNVAAGQRLKYEQYISDWEQNGYAVTISPFMKMPMWDIVHKKGFFLRKIFYTIEGYCIRIKDFFRLRKFDLIYIHMYVTPIGTSFFERIYRAMASEIIFDLEDNRFLGANNEKFNLAQLFRSTEKTKYLVQRSDHVITSSPALNDFCLGYNAQKQCTYISSSIDTDKFTPNNSYSNNKKIVIGWTGTFSSRQYLDLLRPVFIKLKEKRDFKLVVIGNFDYSFPEMDIEVIQWSLQTEVDDMQKIDIGVYPLPMDEWSMGKSGLKAIQYMSFGLPCVSTNISTVKQFINNDENGFLVSSDDEWVQTLIKLIDDADLRRRIGVNARKTALQKFSRDVIKKEYLAVLNSVFE
jgi:L-malate glycosyltransferase